MDCPQMTLQTLFLLKIKFEHNPDLIFLDIEFPGENGFSIFEYFPEPTFEANRFGRFTECNR